jgi:diguanylate cyclase (GGDEF)-like protein
MLPAGSAGLERLVTPFKCSILVVDDDPAVLAVLSALLASEFEVTSAPSAEEARARLEERDFDIVLSDQNMPGRSGVQLLEWLRAERPRTMRILMTGLARIEDVVDAINFSQVHRYVFKPWNNEQLLQALRTAARTVLLERSHEQLLEELRRLNLELEGRVRQRTGELEEANRQLKQKNLILEKMALTDALTGLPNRRAMDRLARNELVRRARYASPLSLALIDADHFKGINERYLLSGGDHVLIWLGRTMAGTLRTVDSIGRIGGEEFLVVAPETGSEGAHILAERIRGGVASSSTSFNDEPITLTVSIGVAVAEADTPAGYDQMKYVAAAALAEAKNGGRNRCVVRVLPRPTESAG